MCLLHTTLTSFKINFEVIPFLAVHTCILFQNLYDSKTENKSRTWTSSCPKMNMLNILKCVIKRSIVILLFVCAKLQVTDKNSIHSVSEINTPRCGRYCATTSKNKTLLGYTVAIFLIHWLLKQKS